MAQRDKAQVKVAGVVEELKIKKTKKGDKMAVLRFEDHTGSTDVIVFPELFNKTAYLLKNDDPLLIDGTAEISENSAKLIAQEIISLSSVRQRYIKAIEINLMGRQVSRDLLEDVKDAALRFQGDCRLLFKLDGSDGRKIVVEAGRHFSVLPCNELIKEMEDLTGNRVEPVY